MDYNRPIVYEKQYYACASSSKYGFTKPVIVAVRRLI